VYEAGQSLRLAKLSLQDVSDSSLSSLRVFTMKDTRLSLSMVCISLQQICVRSLSSCNAKIYGKPFVKDFFDLYNQLWGGTLSTSVDVDKPRSFVEPKFLQPAFCPVPNPYTTQMVQLPKIWRGGKSLLFSLLSSRTC